MSHQIQTERGIITVSDRPYLKEDAVREGYRYAFTVHEGINLKTNQRIVPVDIYSKSENMYHHNFICVGKGDLYDTGTTERN